MSPQPPALEDPGRCRPCRGSGKVASNLGGTPHDVACPWCEGTGRYQPGHDAQRQPAEARTSSAPTSRPAS